MGLVKSTNARQFYRKNFKWSRLKVLVSLLGTPIKFIFCLEMVKNKKVACLKASFLLSFSSRIKEIKMWLLTNKKAVVFWNLDYFLRNGMKRKDTVKHGTSFERIFFVIESYFADLDINKNSWYFLTKFGASGHSDYCDEYKIRRDWLEYLRTT